MTPQCVLFDVDGTLIDTWDLYMEVYWRTLRHFNGDHIAKDTVLSMKPTSELHFIKKNIGSDKLREAHGVMMQYYDQLHDSLFGGVYEEIPALLQSIRERGLLSGIVTGKSSRAWNITSSKIDIGTFDVEIVDDDVEHPKPHPHGLQQALERLNLSGSDCVYIGDTVSDFKAAREAGVRGLLVLWAKNETEKKNFISRARENGAEEFFDHPHEIIQTVIK